MLPVTCGLTDTVAGEVTRPIALTITGMSLRITSATTTGTTGFRPPPAGASGRRSQPEKNALTTTATGTAIRDMGRANIRIKKRKGVGYDTRTVRFTVSSCCLLKQRARE
jgi:hypothetical protein